MSGHPKNAERGLWPPRLRVLAAVVAALLVAGFSAGRVERHVGQARLEFRVAEAATAGEEFESVAEQAPGLLSLAAR